MVRQLYFVMNNDRLVDLLLLQAFEMINDLERKELQHLLSLTYVQEGGGI